MRKIYNISAAFFIAGSLLLSGCGKDYLNQEIPGKLPESEFYKTDEDAVQAATAMYDVLQWDYNTAWTSLYLLKTMPSDESNAGGSGPSDQPGYQNLDDYTFDANNSAVEGGWRQCYYTIYRANKIINLVKPETDLRKRIIGEAKAVRAQCYLDLVTLWGDVPLVLDEVPQSQYTSTPRTAKAQIYAQIESDLKEATEALPLKSAYSDADKFRMSKGCAQSLLGKAYLYQQKWSEAAQQFDAVITSGQYDLDKSVGGVFSKSGEFGVESVFEVQFSEKRNYDWGNFPWGGQPESNIHVQLMGPRSDYYTKAPADSLIGGWGFNVPRQKMYDAFVAAGDEARRVVTVMSEQELKAAGGNWSVASAWDFEGFFQRKYGTFNTYTNSSGGAVAELNYGTNWRLIRYADVLLMAAEAYNKAGNDGRAQTELNKVRKRSNLSDISSGGTALFEDIVKERQLELAFEGVRFIDLVRWGKAAQELGPLGFVTGKHELLPIPDQEVRSAGLKQNPGY